MDRRVDIILPNYNKIDHIDECLLSLKRQTHTNWRCIVIDGYSDDGSWERIQEVAAGDNRFELHQLDRIGLYKSWNVGLDRVEGSYFAILTSDDTWDKTWLETAVDALATHSTAVGAAARTYYLDADSNASDLAILNRYGEDILGNGEQQRVWKGIDYAIASFFMGSVVTSIHSLVMRSDILDSMRFAVDAGPYADWGWCTELGLHGDIVHCPNVPAYWRRYDGQASAGGLEQRTDYGAKLLELFRDLKVRIFKRLKESKRPTFRRAARKHLSTYFPFLFHCPSLQSTKTAPGAALLRFVRLATQYPTVFLNEMLCFLVGKERYIHKKRRQLAQQIIALTNTHRSGSMS